MDKLTKRICEEIVKEESKAQLKALQIGKKLKVKNYIKNDKINLEFEFVEYKKDKHKTKYYEFKLYDKIGMIKNLFKKITGKFVIGLDWYNYKQFNELIKLNDEFERTFENRIINVQPIEDLFVIVVEEINEK